INSTGNQELRFAVSSHIVGGATEIALDFGTDFESLGLSLKTAGTVDLTTSLDLDFSFGIDLTPGLSDSEAFFITIHDLSASARVSAGETNEPNIDELPPEEGAAAAVAAASVATTAEDNNEEGDGEDDGEEEQEEEGVNVDELTGPGLDFELNLGFLKGAIHGGALKLNAKLNLIVDNPDDD